MATYYVKTSGNNANDGLSDANAKATPAAAATAAGIGDTILLRCGDTFTDNNYVTPKTNQIWGNYGAGDKPIMAPFPNSLMFFSSATISGVEIWGIDMRQGGTEQIMLFTGAATNFYIHDCNLQGTPDYALQFTSYSSGTITLTSTNFSDIGETAVVFYGDNCQIVGCNFDDVGNVNATGAHNTYTKGKNAYMAYNSYVNYGSANSACTIRRTNTKVVGCVFQNSTSGNACIDWYWEEKSTNTEGITWIYRCRGYNVGVGMYHGPANTSIITVKNVTGAVNNGSGLFRLTVTGHGVSTSDRVYVNGVGGVSAAADNKWTVTVIDANTVDLQGSTFTGTYTSGGTLQRVTAEKLLIFNNTWDGNGISGGGAQGQCFDFSDPFARVFDIKFFNNVCIRWSSRYARWGGSGVVGARSGTTWDQNNNCYWESGGTGTRFQFGGSTFTFANYVALAAINEANSIITDPGVSSGPYFLPLSGSSNVVNAGTATIDAAVTFTNLSSGGDLDYSGAAPDIGAFEWITVAAGNAGKRGMMMGV